MKVVLWAALSANGSYLRATGGTPPDVKMIENVYMHARAAGCVVFGRVTHDELIGRGENPASLGVDVVVVSSKATPREAASVVETPRAAIERMHARKHDTILVSGGAALLNAFLAERLADELILSYSPHLENTGLRVELPEGVVDTLQLLTCNELGNGIVQMIYSLKRK